MSVHAKLLFMQKKKKKKKREMGRPTLLLLWHVGPVADPSGIGRVALPLHGLRPTGILFQSAVKMPPWPCGGKHSDNLYVSLPLLKNAPAVCFSSWHGASLTAAR